MRQLGVAAEDGAERAFGSATLSVGMADRVHQPVLTDVM